MIKLPKIIIFLFLISASACFNTLKPRNLKNEQKLVALSKGPCFGNCPVFTLTIYENGLATFQGKEHTDKQGLYMKKIGKEAVKHLTNQCAAANLWQFQGLYKSQLADLPSVTLTYYEGEKSKTITGKKERPEAVLDIEAILDDIAFSKGWQQVEPASSDLAPGVIPNELIIKLNRGIEALAWSKSYVEQEVSLKKSLSADKTFWLITFNSKLISPQEMVNLLKKDPDVFSVQFNQNF